MALWEERQSCHPTFKFWNLILQLELLLFEFVKSIRSGNLQLFINTLMKIAPWVFALDHHRYARSLPVHINEMSRIAQIKITNKWMRKSKGLVKQLDWLKMKQHYRDGYFVVQKFHGYRMNLKVLMRVWTTCGSIMTFPTLFNQFSRKKWKVYCQPLKMWAILLMTTVTIFLTYKQRPLWLKRLLRTWINWRMFEKNNFEILLNKGCGKDKYRYQIRSAKTSIPCLRQLDPILLQEKMNS